jgi:hypothetical protein
VTAVNPKPADGSGGPALCIHCGFNCRVIIACYFSKKAGIKLYKEKDKDKSCLFLVELKGHESRYKKMINKC